ncbi:SCO2525 family SAM-dependent methyltransferase [Cryptosporangium aurantiacum]|uniref:NNMT/PNMT/TEMT family protein n=1 Tax=Cryptosporangium aurantiacum TaxID=134849 RepID=A0A1M7RJS8_9ACTN|nr:SCO2525 family SAM-dependent methyltransferase [Cryptosporangium aurantiacum]SHN46400.1 hypothetical protein SAMN05443668_11587 [Cryptosporangium aurantiacum]
MTQDDRSGAGPAVRNADADWDRFDPSSYVDDNYLQVRDDDRHILRVVRDFFTDAGFRRGRFGIRRGERTAVDVGTGANLYPALAMLPFVDRLVLVERGAANVAWLDRQQAEFDDNWLLFWNELTTRRPYRRVRDPRQLFRQKAHIRHDDLFRLKGRQYDLGTMFFVAESLSTKEAEFIGAMESFVGSLRQGAPFATSHMENSHGYSVHGVPFPAHAVDKAAVEDVLTRVATDVSVQRVPYGADGSLREGHEAMIVATGRAGPRAVRE